MTLKIKLSWLFWIFVWPLPLIGPALGLKKGLQGRPDAVPFFVFFGSLVMLGLQIIIGLGGLLPLTLEVVSTANAREFALPDSEFNNVSNVTVRVRRASVVQWLPWSWSEEKEYIRSQELDGAGNENGWRHWIDISAQSAVSDKPLSSNGTTGPLESAYRSYRVKGKREREAAKREREAAEKEAAEKELVKTLLQH